MSAGVGPDRRGGLRERPLGREGAPGAAWPRLSIIIPTRNRASYLKRGMDRLLESDYPNLEIIVMDGASTDETVPLLEHYGPKITKWVSERDGGEYAALNKGILWSTGDYILHFTDDDIIIPSSLKTVGEFAAGHPEYDILFAQVNLWREIDGVPIQYGVTRFLDPKSIRPAKYCRGSAVPPTQGAFVHRRLHDRVGFYATDFVNSDYEFWTRAIKSGAAGALLPVVVADYHYTGDNTVLKYARRIRRDHIRIAFAYGTVFDKIYAMIKQGLLAVVTDGFHALGLHPLRWRAARKAKETRSASLPGRRKSSGS